MARIEKHGNLVTQIVKLPTTMRNHPYSPSLEAITWIKEGDIWQHCNWPNWTMYFVGNKHTKESGFNGECYVMPREKEGMLCVEKKKSHAHK